MQVSSLQAQVLGIPTFNWQGEALKSSSQKVIALLAYLAVQSEPVSRDLVAELLWSVGKYHNVRQALFNLRSLPGAQEWLKDDNAIYIQVKTDLSVFEKAVQTKDYKQALSLYKGTLLEDIKVRGAPVFTDWLEQERARIAALYQKALSGRADELANNQHYEQAIELYTKRIAEDALDETSQQKLIKLEFARGQPRVALDLYEQYRRQLIEDLGVEPLSETQHLATEIKQVLHQQLIETPVQVSYALPDYSSRFIGRNEEQAQLTRYLQTARLVSIVGTGGVGKTRLSIQVAEQLHEAFKDGICFIPLAATTNAEFIVLPIADSLGLDLSNRLHHESQLLDFLREKELLLIFDNAEHLLDGLGLLDQLLDNCPKLSLLVSSREPLGFEEKQLELRGLAYPVIQELSAKPYEAVELFVELARQVDSHFQLDVQNELDIIRICTLLEGLPLALELAAAWVTTLSLDEIANEIEKNLNLLKDGSFEKPKRQRSLQATFDYSWTLLTDVEQKAIVSLAVFKSGFNQDAAEKVTNSSLRTLLALSKKSLLRKEPGRFTILELIRQCALEKVEHSSPIFTKHSAYFATLVKTHSNKFKVDEQKQVRQLFALENDNIVQAWQYIVEQKDETRLLSSLAGFYQFFKIRGLGLQAYKAFKTAISSFSEEPLHSHLKLRAAAFANRLAHIEDAHQLLKECQAYFNQHQNYADYAFTHLCLGDNAYLRDDYDEGEGHYTTSLQSYQSLKDSRGIGLSLDGLGTIAFARGDFLKAKDYYKQSLELAKQSEDARNILIGLKNTGIGHAVTGGYETAKAHLEETVSQARSLEDKRMLVSALNNLGKIYTSVAMPQESRKAFEECIYLSREIGARWNTALALSNLGELEYFEKNYDAASYLYADALRLFEALDHKREHVLTKRRIADTEVIKGNLRIAWQYYTEVLQDAKELDANAYMLDAIEGMADILLRQANTSDYAALLLVFVMNHPNAEEGTKIRATELLHPLDLSEGELSTLTKKATPLLLSVLSEELLTTVLTF